MKNCIVELKITDEEKLKMLLGSLFPNEDIAEALEWYKTSQCGDLFYGENFRLEAFGYDDIYEGDK